MEDYLDADFVDFVNGIYLTKSYKAWDFQGRGIIDAGGYSDKGVDIDGDDLYDSLMVSINIDIRTPDYYVWQATMFGNQMSMIDFTQNEGPLKTGVNKIVFTFKGSEIRKSGQNGPYEIPGVAMYGHDKGANITDTGAIRTQKYKYTEFE